MAQLCFLSRNVKNERMEIAIFRNFQDVDFINGLHHGPGGEILFFLTISNAVFVYNLYLVGKMIDF